MGTWQEKMLAANERAADAAEDGVRLQATQYGHQMAAQQAHYAQQQAHAVAQQLELAAQTAELRAHGRTLAEQAAETRNFQFKMWLQTADGRAYERWHDQAIRPLGVFLSQLERWRETWRLEGESVPAMPRDPMAVKRVATIYGAAALLALLGILDVAGAGFAAIVVAIVLFVVAGKLRSKIPGEDERRAAARVACFGFDACVPAALPGWLSRDFPAGALYELIDTAPRVLPRPASLPTVPALPVPIGRQEQYPESINTLLAAFAREALALRS